eukprot:NODE_33_length_2582_cov_278.747131.p1 GENE.NODE_33_length_2582_cov_278.747131~~NODE_33_length_2582_cov_278.747131.p1  ORF type:complete len:739 (-),score=193.01 NODE_33_length_2582_cov_278.747131:352-2445(-)
MAALAGTLVATAPSCAGSGLPEVKGYLNGNHIKDFFTMRSLAVRTVAVVLATAAGFPIGREGPTVCIGGCLGYGIVHTVAKRRMGEWVKLGATKHQVSVALIVDEERFQHAKRIGCSLGGAAGIATAFNAPIGGILYMLEEVTVNSWPPELTFRAFVCSVVAALVSRGLINISGYDVGPLLLYEENSAEVGSWAWHDIPFFVVLAAVMGLFSSIFTRALLIVWDVRRRFDDYVYAHIFRLLEVVLLAIVIAIIFSVLPLSVGCKDDLENANGDQDLHYVMHHCTDNHHNSVATLLFSGTERAVLHLYSRLSGNMGLSALAATLVGYTTLAVLIAGIAIPMGNFIPTMLIGALAGRFFGEALQQVDMAFDISSPGVYALMGSGAMLSGFTHMTIAIAVLLSEALQDFSILTPLMLTIFVSHFVSHLLQRRSYDEVLILRKGIPYLEAELPAKMDDTCGTALDLCALVPEIAQLPPEASVRMVRRALQVWAPTHFPIIHNDACIGILTRTRLLAALNAFDRATCSSCVPCPEASNHSLINGCMGCLSIPHGGPHTRTMLDEVDVELGEFIDNVVATSPRRHCADAEDVLLPLHRFMDPAPYTLVGDMPAMRFYPLFAKSGITAVAVVSRAGVFCGILSRFHLLSSESIEHGAPMVDNSMPSRDACQSSASSSRQAPLECNEGELVGDYTDSREGPEISI